ncbi:MAG: hypothetical protein EA423_01185 [Phycisphaerales bacterium]|nr:MAG: hypothetical protein EA423_01185 [Phycisphaerales bacterium]
MITQQQIPGEMISGDEDESIGVPDLCIFGSDGWALLIESKVQSKPSIEQLRRHIRTAERKGFTQIDAVMLSVDAVSAALPERSTARTWRELYQWLRDRSADSTHARDCAKYFEVFESKMVARDYDIRGTITMFSGIRFDEDNPFHYREAKRLIKLLGDELQPRKDLATIGADPRGSRRTAITGSQTGRVWDFIPLKASKGSTNFTSFPHLTMVLNEEHAGASVTVPNGVSGGFRTKLKSKGQDGFFDLLLEIERNLRPVLKSSKGSKGLVYAVQRNFPSQRSAGRVDANLNADLRTIVPGKRREAKYQPQWVAAVYESLIAKRSNIQFGVSVHFSYDCPVIRSAEAADLFAKSWIAMSPLLEFVME